MNKNCEIVQDLLPLYIDDVCSETSREMIREHLSGCPDCTKLLKQMQDVMEGLKNNPLLKNGISEKPEKENAAPKLREDNF